MKNKLDKVDYKVARRASSSKKLSDWQIAVFVLLVVIIVASCLTIVFLFPQVNNLRQQNDVLIATNETLEQTVSDLKQKNDILITANEALQQTINAISTP